MKQVVKDTNKKSSNKHIPKTNSSLAKKRNGLQKKRILSKQSKHPQYGTSKLEEDFANQFLDKLGVKYQYQYEAKDIGRFYDFYLTDNNLLIEIDGDYWHGNPEVYKEDELRFHQKHQQRVDEHKTKWALLHGIPIMHIWEKDIREKPKQVLKELKERLFIQDKEKTIIENKKKPHINKLNKKL